MDPRADVQSAPNEDSARLAEGSPLLNPELGAEPYSALHYHLGMMLGVGDLQTEQAYHRGKARLHAAWLHRPGVIWGYRVTADKGELRVAPGLATDPGGRELYLDRPMRLDLGAWFDARRAEAAAGRGDLDFIRAAESGKEVAAAVLLRYRACPAREVPALSDADAGIGGSDRATAPSRVRDEVELVLLPGEPGRPDPLPAGFRRLRLLLGIDPAPRAPGAGATPATGPDAAWLAEATDIVHLAAGWAAMHPAERLLHIQDLAARDSADLSPPQDPHDDGPRHFPWGTGAPGPAADGVVLCAVRGLRIKINHDDNQDRAQIDGDPAVDLSARPVHLPASLQQLLLASAVTPREG